LSSEKKEVKTSGQVDRKYDELRKAHQKKHNHGDGYDYYFTDSDNDGLADVHDIDDLNPDIQDYSQTKPLQFEDRKVNRSTKDKHIPKSSKKKSVEHQKLKQTSSKTKEANQVKQTKTGSKDKKASKEKGEKTSSKRKPRLKFNEDIKKGKLESTKKGSVISLASSGQEVLRRHNQFERLEDANENSALQASELGREVSTDTIRGTSRRLQHGLKTRNRKVVATRSEARTARTTSTKSNFNFEKSLKNNKTYQNSKGLNKYYQKQQIKSSYNKKVYGGFSKRAEKVLKGAAKKLKQIASLALKKIGLPVIGITLVVLVLISILSGVVGAFSNGISVVMATSYQSDEYQIHDTENIYNRLEADLKYAIENVETDHSGYDEYRYNIGTIGHDPQVLVAYLTAVYGEFTASSVSNELSRIFDEQYSYTLTATTEVRTRTVYASYTDPVTGVQSYTSYQVQYNWHILNVSLTVNDLEAVLSAVLTQEEQELFDVLMETKGNFASLPSPLRVEWRSSITSMYGYRLDPFDGHVEFHTGIDIAHPVGTELVAVMDGTVTDVGYASGYGNYLEITHEKGQSAFYAHCSVVSVSIGDEVKLGQKVGEMGSTGNSTGSHLHLEVKDAAGNRLNPYFYLSDEIAEDPN